MSARHEEMSFTHSAILQLREFDRTYPQWSDAVKDQIVLVAKTLARLEDADEVLRYHLASAAAVVKGGHSIRYCPECKAYELTTLAEDSTDYCHTHGCYRERILLSVLGPKA